MGKVYLQMMTLIGQDRQTKTLCMEIDDNQKEK